MSPEEYAELHALRAYKEKMETSRVNRCFIELEQLMNRIGYDPVMSPRVFRLLGECILVLREELQ